MLKLTGVSTKYGRIQILHRINLEVHEGELVSLLGGNACGKTTTMRTILGLVRPFEGTIEFKGERIDHLNPAAISRRGIVPVLEGRRIFPELTVEENLEMGAYLRKDKREIKNDIQKMYSMFPILFERRRQAGGSLSGGEQQMLAMARAMMARPVLLIMDEPSMGLSPVLVDNNFELIQRVHKEGLSILLVEQNANMALSIADRGYVLQVGEIVLSGKAGDLRNNPAMKRAYLSTAMR